jgi:putrescine aminotransferase
VSPAFVRLLGVLGYGRVFERARGLELWDTEGRRYVDFLAGFGTNILGHAPPRLHAALRRALDEEAPNVIHTAPEAAAADLAARLAETVPHLPMCLFSLSGGEAVEAAIKLARASTGKKTIVYASGGFHGMGLGGLAVMGHARFQRPFQPLLPACVAVPFGDADALRFVMRKRDVAAVLLEPIQAEAGVVVPPAGYLAAAERACRDAGALLLLDEVQTGLGRTGKRFAFEHDGLEPDAVILGKGLGGGVLPVSVTLTRRALHRAAFGSMWTFDLHGSTYAGYALGCRVALEVLAALDDESLAERAAARGARLVEGLRARLRHPFVREVRGRGLLVGIELGPTGQKLLDKAFPIVTETVSRQMFGQWLAVRLLERGILCQPSTQAWNVLKLTPPLTVGEAEIDAAVSTIADILSEYEDLTPLLLDVSRRFAKQLVAGGAFG